MYAYTQKFDSLNTGDLNGQDGWSGNAAFDVQTSVVFKGAKAVSFHNNTDDGIFRTIKAMPGGRVHVAIRSTANNVTGPQIRLHSGATGLCLVAMGSSGQIILWTGSTTQNLGAYSANTWYEVVIEFDCRTDKFRVSIDNGANFSAWYAFYNSSTATTIDKIGIFAPTASTSGTGYADDIIATSIESPEFLLLM